MINIRINLFGLVLFYLYIWHMENSIVTGQAMINLIEDLFKRDENGFPLLEDGTIDWDQTMIEKNEALHGNNRSARRKTKSERHGGSNYTKPKPKRKKK